MLRPRPLNAAQLRRKFKGLPKPEAPPDGIFIMDRMIGEEVFITWTELQEACRDMFRYPAGEIEAATGKMDYKRDPTYNIRRKP